MFSYSTFQVCYRLQFQTYQYSIQSVVHIVFSGAAATFLHIHILAFHHHRHSPIRAHIEFRIHQMQQQNSHMVVSDRFQVRHHIQFTNRHTSTEAILNVLLLVRIHRSFLLIPILFHDFM